MAKKQINNFKQKNGSASLKTKKRIFIFNIDPQNDEITSFFLSKENYDLLVKNQDDIIYIFLTKFSFNTIFKYLKKATKLKTGYIISSNGSYIYSIANKKVLCSYALTRQAKSFLIHEGILKSLLIISNSKSKSYCYSEDINKFVKFKDEFGSDVSLMESYLIYHSFIHENEFLSFTFYDTDINILIEKHRIIKLLEDDLNINVSLIENNMFSASSAESLPIHAYYKILEDLDYQIDIDKTYYFVLNSLDMTLWNAFSKNHYLNFQYLIDNKKLIETKFKIQNIFLPKNVIEIISSLISKTTSFRIHSIVGDEKKFIELINKNQK